MHVIIIGASTTGKTTIAKHLGQELPELPIQEADAILTNLNGGAYPQDTELKMKKLAPTMVKQVLAQPEIIFFTNTDYFTIQDLAAARNDSFRVVLLQLAKKKMLERNQQRVAEDGYDDLSSYFDSMLDYQQKIIDAEMVDQIVDCDQTIEKVVAQIKRIVTQEL